MWQAIHKSLIISVLEANIMLVVWEEKRITVRKLHEILLKNEMRNKDSDFIPYTTVMSTMASLAEKKILKVDRSKKTYTYSAQATVKMWPIMTLWNICFADWGPGRYVKYAIR
jgi:predicted transcriptional regulator